MTTPEILSHIPLRDILLSAGIRQEGHFIFANGGHGLVKLEMDVLEKAKWQYEHVLALLGKAEGLPPADVILGVPSGGQNLAEALVERGLLEAPIARLQRIPGAERRDYAFVTDEDRELALTAQSPRIYEDVVSTLSSVAGVVKLLEPTVQDIHSLAIWKRGYSHDVFSVGVTEHSLHEEHIPIYAENECPVCNPTNSTPVS